MRLSCDPVYHGLSRVTPVSSSKGLALQLEVDQAINGRDTEDGATPLMLACGLGDSASVR